MANFGTRLVLFLSSYAPLFLIFAVKQYPHSHKVSLIFSLVAVISLVVLTVFIKTFKSLAPSDITVKDHSSKDGDSMSYIVTYLVPFLDIKFDQIENVIGLLITLVVLGVLYVNSNMIYTNPVLNLAGYHIFDIHTSEERPMVLVTRRSFLKSGMELRIVLMGDYAGIEVRDDS